MKRRKSTRGFSLMEVMITAAILGIGVLAGVRLFTFGVDGTEWTVSRSTATTIAIQRLEFLGGQGIAQLPAGCTGPAGCKVDQTTMAAPVACTQEVLGMESDPTSSFPGGKFRVDTVVEPHPDLARQRDAQLVTISVCWQEIDDTVNQAQLTRLFVPPLEL